MSWSSSLSEDIAAEFDELPRLDLEMTGARHGGTLRCMRVWRPTGKPYAEVLVIKQASIAAARACRRVATKPKPPYTIRGK